MTGSLNSRWVAGAVIGGAVLLAAAMMIGIERPGAEGHVPPVHPKVQAAIDIIHRQVAADLNVTIEPGALRGVDSGGQFYYVCGPVGLFRPGSGDLAINEQQRVIVTVNRHTGAGRATFDGSSDPAGKAAFAAQYTQHCPR